MKIATVVKSPALVHNVKSVMWVILTTNSIKPSVKPAQWAIFQS